MEHLDLSLAGLVLRLETEQPLQESAAFRPFLTAGKPDFAGRFCKVPRLPSFDRAVLYRGNCYRVHPGNVRTYFDATRGESPYAVARTDYPSGRVQIDFLSHGQGCIAQMDNAFFHLGFEGALIRHDRICFHASCIRTDFGGILFSGPSGIGKSTQAQLWQTFRGATLINGDRPILQKTDDGFLAWGSPYAGSSACYLNECVPVRAMVFLSQSRANTIRRLDTAEAFRKLYSGMTMYSWDGEFVTRACDLAEELTKTVPCYALSCLPDETAVECLERRLKEDKL